MSDQGGARGMRESGGAARMIGSGGAEGGAKTEQNSLWGDKSRAPPPPPKQHDRPYTAVSRHHVVFLYRLW